MIMQDLTMPMVNCAFSHKCKLLYFLSPSAYIDFNPDEDYDYDYDENDDTTDSPQPFYRTTTLYIPPIVQEKTYPIHQATVSIYRATVPPSPRFIPTTRGYIPPQFPTTTSRRSIFGSLTHRLSINRVTRRPFTRAIVTEKTSTSSGMISVPNYKIFVQMIITKVVNLVYLL